MKNVWKIKAPWVLVLIFVAAGDYGLGVNPFQRRLPSGLCVSSVQQLAMNSGMVRNSNFTHDRDLDSYLFQFGAPFEQALKARSDGKPQVWIDLGAGEAHALRGFLAAHAGTREHGKWQGVGVGVEAPKDAFYEQDLAAIHERGGADAFHYRTGFFANIPDAELPKADLITDYYGVLSYTDSFSRDFERSLALLKPGGKMILIMERPSFELKVGGKNVLFSDYVKQIGGVDMEPHDKTTVTFTIVRNEEPLRVPELTLTKLTSAKPPYREFEFAPSAALEQGRAHQTDLAAEHARILRGYGLGSPSNN